MSIYNDTYIILGPQYWQSNAFIQSMYLNLRHDYRIKLNWLLVLKDTIFLILQIHAFIEENFVEV